MSKKKNKKLYVPLRLHSGEVSFSGLISSSSQTFRMTLPSRCSGILFAFETKKAAKEFMGKDATLLTIELSDD